MTNKLNDIVITAAFRTPIGAYRGLLKDLSSDKIGSNLIKAILTKVKLKAEDIDELIMGQVLTGTAGQNPARQAAI